MSTLSIEASLLAAIVLLSATIRAQICPPCAATEAEAAPICAVQLNRPNEVHNFTACLLQQHNCRQPLDRFVEVLADQCPPPYRELPCEAIVCPDTDSPICGEAFGTRKRLRFGNECKLMRANCRRLDNAYVNLGNVRCDLVGD